MQPNVDHLARAVVRGATESLDGNWARIRHCVGQLSEEQLWWRPAPSMNSIGNLMLHLAGNLRQWIVAGVGGAVDDRDRPSEFAARGPISSEELLRRLEAVVADARSALERVTAAELLAQRPVQGNEITGVAAIFGSIPHFQGHTQEIICLTRMQLGDAYKFYWRPGQPEPAAAP